MALPEHVKLGGPQQAVIYSEHIGKADGVGNMGHWTAFTCKSLCPSAALPDKKCLIEGDPGRHGEYLRRSWQSAGATTDYTETWAMMPVSPTDICTMRMQLLRTLRIETFDGDELTILSIDLNKGEGRRQVVKKKRRDSADVVERRVQALRASGYEPAGVARYAGYSCLLLRRAKGELVNETCLLEDSAAPTSALGVPIRHMTLAHSMMNPAHPEARTYGETQVLKFDATVPTAVFTPPANIEWNNRKNQK
jgi:hypothetical protein